MCQYYPYLTLDLRLTDSGVIRQSSSLRFFFFSNGIVNLDQPWISKEKIRVNRNCLFIIQNSLIVIPSFFAISDFSGSSITILPLKLDEKSVPLHIGHLSSEVNILHFLQTFFLALILKSEPRFRYLR